MAPILVLVLLIVVALTATIVTYSWVITFKASPTNQAIAVLYIEEIRFFNITSTDYVEIILRNSGTTDAKIDRIYVGTSCSNCVLQKSVSYNPSTQIITTDSPINMTITYDWTEGKRYYFNIATKEGQTLHFSEEV